MPRRDGDVFLFGTAMTVSPYVLLRSLPDRAQPALRRGPEWQQAGL
jgi:hypothetical protein